MTYWINLYSSGDSQCSENIPEDCWDSYKKCYSFEWVHKKWTRDIGFENVRFCPNFPVKKHSLLQC